MDNRDFRVRAFIFIENSGVAKGLYNHVLGLMPDAVDINPNKPNAEMRYVKLEDHYIIKYDLCFPSDKQDEADGLYNHTKNTPSKALPDERICYVELEHCGHRIKQKCEIIKRYVIS